MAFETNVTNEILAGNFAWVRFDRRFTRGMTITSAVSYCLNSKLNESRNCYWS